MAEVLAEKKNILPLYIVDNLVGFFFGCLEKGLYFISTNEKVQGLPPGV